MISDTLSEAGDEIRRYLDEMPEVYSGEMREKIERLLLNMDAIRSELDAPPASSQEVETYEIQASWGVLRRGVKQVFYVNGKRAGTTVDDVQHVITEPSRSVVAKACATAKNEEGAVIIFKSGREWLFKREA
jgi:hypothetical protein